MTPAETPLDETVRFASLQATDLLFTPYEERFDRITRLASKLLDMPISLVTLVADRCQWFKSAQGLETPETPREVSFCGHAILGEDTFVVENATSDPRFADNPLVTGNPHIRFYAGHPLHAEDGSRVGTLCVIDRQPRQLSQEQLKVLQDLAAIVETELQRGLLSDTQRRLVHEMKEIERKSMIDRTTLLWNQTAIMELMRGELEKAERGAPFTIAMIAVDRFDAVQSRLGSESTALALREIASRIRRATRQFDLVGRYEGQTFIALLVSCGLERAQGIAESVRRSIGEQPIETPAGQMTASVSIGLAPYRPLHVDPALLVSDCEAALDGAIGKGGGHIVFEAPKLDRHGMIRNLWRK